MARRPLALRVAMCRSGLRTSTSAVVCRSAAVASPGPRLSKRRVTGSSVCTRTRRSLRFKMMSVTSSFTPGQRGELVQGLVEADLGHRRAGDGRQQGAAQRVAERVAEAGVERADGEPLPVVLLFVDGLDGRSLDDEHRGDSCCVAVGRGSVGLGGGDAGGLLRVQLDDELLLHGLVDVLAQRRVQHGDAEAAVAGLEPGRGLAVEGVQVAADREVLAGARPSG